MKRDFLKEVGLNEEQIEKIMAEYGKSVEKIRLVSENSIKKAQNDNLILSADSKAPEILKLLINEEDDIQTQLSSLQNTYPWLFNGNAPVFSGFCETEVTVDNPFRYGAGI